VGKTEANRHLGRSRRRLEDNIKIDPQDVRGRACIGLIWLRIETGELLL